MEGNVPQTSAGTFSAGPGRLPGAPPLNFGPTPTPFPEEFAGKAQVGEYTLPIVCEGSGEPTIILESGLGGGSWGDTDLQRFKRITRVCWYPRVGLNRVKDINTPQTTLDHVQALHSLLDQTGVPGPYIRRRALTRRVKYAFVREPISKRGGRGRMRRLFTPTFLEICERKLMSTKR